MLCTETVSCMLTCTHTQDEDSGLSELALAETSLTGSEGFSTSVQAAKVLSTLHYTQTGLGKLSPDSDRYAEAASPDHFSAGRWSRSQTTETVLRTRRLGQMSYTSLPLPCVYAFLV